MRWASPCAAEYLARQGSTNRGSKQNIEVMPSAKQNDQLGELGFCEFFAEQLTEDMRARAQLGRIVEEQRGGYRVAGEWEGWAELSGRLRHQAASRASLPAVGDWVALSTGAADGRATISDVLARRSQLSRAAAGTAVEEQIVAANVDTVFLVTSFNQDLNAHRLDRYLTMVWEGGAVPVVLLNKMDLCQDAELESTLKQARARLPFVDVHAVSALSAAGLAALLPYLRPKATVALLGSSGVGKSSLVNRLTGGDLQRVAEIRETDDRGRHTTTSRQLIKLPCGALLIDTPGMRELRPWSATTGLDAAFADIAELAEECRFADCSHTREPGCAIVDAVSEGRLEADRLEHYRALLAEAAFEARKHDKAAAAAEKRRWKQIHQAQKALYRDRDRS